MASDSPRARIDQFFASRKRKPPGPKDEKKSDKDPKSPLDGSPSAKGNLDSYLVESSDASSCAGHGAALSRHDSVRRNLSSDISLVSDVPKKPILISCSSGSGDSSNSVEGLSGVGIGALDEAPADVLGSGEQGHILDDPCDAGIATGGNSELKRFATDFLSLYCSDLPTAVNIPVDQELKGQKRNGSPSLLVACNKTCSKKQCVIDQSSLSQKPSKFESSTKPEDADVVHCEDLEESGGKHHGESDGGDTSLKRCSMTPNSILMKTGHCVPDLSTSVLDAGVTPRSVSRSSMFSPGDEFWNEAIQVADGLLAPVGKLPESLCFLKSGRSGNKLLQDKSSCAVPQGAKSFSRLDGDDLAARDVELKGCVKPIAKPVEAPIMLLSGSQPIEISRLPVKHFDFCQEENSHDRDIDVDGVGTLSGIRHVNRGSLKQKCLATSDFPKCHEDQEKIETFEEIPKSSSNTSSDISPHDLSYCTRNLPHIVENGSDLSVHEGKCGLPTQVNGSKHMHKDKNLSHDLPLPCCYAYDTEKEIHSRSTAHGYCEEATTPSSSMLSNDRLRLTSWLPSEVCSVYMKKGISKLYPWQVECLLVDGVLEKRNLVYCASTSAGKSFVAEILMLRRVISTGKMALLVLPYVSICAEKAEHLELLLEPLGKHVRSFYGNQGGASLPKDTSVAVCTIEKANSLINRLLEEGRLSELGIIVIDELHMVGDQHRGYLLELMLTKLRYASGEGNLESSSGESSGSSSGKADPSHGFQIVGMSATMPNVAAVADWLQAALYQTDFRPVPLEEYIKVGNTIFDKKMNAVRKIPKRADLGGKDPDHIVELCNEVVQEGHSVLLFCSSRKGCETTARHVSTFLKKFSIGGHEVDCEFNDASSAIEALRRCPAGLDPILEETLPSGVAYHHAGLTVEERDIVETCYRKGLVRVLTATSTLAAGVNLPARRVIFRQPRVGRDFIDGTRYRQMSGRAGRTGIDTRGESILVCKPDEVKRIAAILNDSCPPLQSCLSEDKNGMTHAIMEVVAGGIVQTASDIHRYVRCTLLNSTVPFQEVVKSAQDSLRWLCHKKFLEWNEETKLYSTTPLGRAAFGSSLTPEESLVVLDDLSRAREGFVLASDLHLVYLVTPINVEVEPDWELYYERFMELSALDQSVGNRVGVVEPFLMRMAHGAPMALQEKLRGRKSVLHNRLQTRNVATETSTISNEETLRVCRRFYVALMLLRLVQEVPISDVCESFKVARGMIQALQENAGRFALMVSLFCERLGWHDLEGLVAKFQNRVSFGVRAEIVELTAIPYVKGSRARALYKAGLRTPLAIAEANVYEIAKALFESSAWAGQDDLALRRMHLGVAKKIKNGARKIILDQAEEARIAAFSAFKSLGLHVPQFSRPLLSTVAQDSLGRDNTSISCDHSSHDIKKENLTDTKDITVEASGGVNTTEAVQHKINSTDAVMLINASTVTSSSPYKLNQHDMGTSGDPYIPESTSHANGILDVALGYDPKGGDMGRVDGPNCSNEDISDKGPINASNFPGGFDSFLDQWGAVGEFCFDVHFLERPELQHSVLFEVFGLAICWENLPVYYVNFPKDLVASGKQDKCDVWEVALSRWKRIAQIMGKSSVRKITWNLKIQIQVLKYPCISIQRFGRLCVEYKKLNDIELIDNSYISLPSVSVNDGIDICLVAWILSPDEECKSTPKLEKVVKKRLSSEAVAAAARDGRWRNQMCKAAHNGCCRRAAQVRALVSVLLKLLVSEGLVEVLTRIENPLVKVLADMELWGIGVDMEACLQARHILMRKLKELEKEAYRLAGMPFSLYTAADIANVLFTHLKLPIPRSCNKGKLHPSTDKHSLDQLRGRHPIISVIKEHRTLAKLLNSTLGSICSRAKLCMKSQKYTIQGHWLQTSTATGRLSMEEPNLQCVEHLVVFTTQHHDESNSSVSNVSHYQINARDFFIPTQDNWLLLTADYSQIELRLMAHFSKDSALIELLSKPDGDVFKMIAARWTGRPESAISSQEREHTKRLIYGILYGMGANSLAEQLECSSEEAAEKIQSFKTSFPGVSSWLHEAVASCCHKGYVETLMGRKRFLSKIKFGNNKEKAKAQRQAVNSICQGSAADIIKIAMITIHPVIAEGSELLNLNSGLATKFSNIKGHCRIVLQVHDELVLEVDPHLIRDAGILLQMSMESAVSLLVPLHVKLKVGKTWGSLEPFQPELSPFGGKN
ncbi:helicase and polymerase-containing protein TEBICHI isoform X1 [Elaeis guineensis]|uniref:helicase and polymerase-containing protein TEBICHI isoform X1 n=1 Tax=Elaeis guineensis var. tenera TaxID=51953 RepID=UPI00094F7204